MDTRKEYRVRPDVDGMRWFAEYYRTDRRLFSSVSSWHCFCVAYNEEEAEAMCKRHAGEGTKYLGRLP